MKKYKRMKIYKHLDDVETIKKIIEAGGDLNKVFRKTGEHALFYTLKEDINIDILALLLDSNIDVNLQNKNGDSVIHICEDTDKLNLLLHYGADVNLVNKKVHTPIFGCIDLEKATLLVEHGADLNVRDKNGEHFLKSLHVSDFDLMKLFIDKGLNRFMEKNGLTLDTFFDTWSTLEVQVYFENKLKTQPDLYKVKV